MKSALARCLALLIMFLSARASAAPDDGPTRAARPAVAIYYGPAPAPAELRAFDWVVLEPGHRHRLADLQAPHNRLLAYVSVGEVLESRDYFPRIPKDWLVGENRAWGSRVVDQSRPEWPEFFLTQVVAPLWEQGYRGFFLDTLDSYQLVAKGDAARAAQEAGLRKVVRGIKARFPEAILILNRGFEILPGVHKDVAAVAAESLFQGWDATQKRYTEVPEADRAWLSAKLAGVRDRYRLPVVAIDYVAPADRERARATATRIRERGLIPWVTDADLQGMGVGEIEVLPRKVLLLHDGDENLMQNPAHRFAALPLNYLGYVPEYLDVRRPLPAGILAGRYAGAVVWLGDGSAGGADLGEWLTRQARDGLKIAVLGGFGLPPGAEALAELGLQGGGVSAAARGHIEVVTSGAEIGFEAPPRPRPADFAPLTASPGSRVLLKLADERGRTQDAAAYTDWGGYVLAPYVVASLPGINQNRWVVDPFAFLHSALRLPDMPVPDVTTEGGRRVLLVHHDGDGFASRAEFPGSPLAARVLLEQVLTRYPVPMAVSVIQGETARDGLYARLSPELEAVARRMFALDHVEPASHSYSHPFYWRKAAAEAKVAQLEAGGAASAEGAEPEPVDSEGYGLAIPGYRFDVRTEVDGSVDYVNRLTPPGKRCRLFLWTGDCNPDAEAVTASVGAGVLNMNGGDTLMTRSNPSVTAVSPLGVPKGGAFQVYAPMQNENVYTDLWRGPFYGYQRVLETFELTDRPRRLKPVNVYFHTYAATKQSSLDALKGALDWAMAQNLSAIPASDYAARVLAFNRTLVARTPGGFRIADAGPLTEFRLPPALGYPDLGRSPDLAGFSEHAGARYMHVADAGEDGDGLTELRLGLEPPAGPYVAEANGRLAAFRRTPAGLHFEARAHLPLRLTIENAAGCALVAPAAVSARRARGRLTLEMETAHVQTFDLRCPAA